MQDLFSACGNHEKNDGKNKAHKGTGPLTEYRICSCLSIVISTQRCTFAVGHDQNINTLTWTADIEYVNTRAKGIERHDRAPSTQARAQRAKATDFSLQSRSDGLGKIADARTYEARSPPIARSAQA